MATIADLKFGDVIEFKYAGQVLRAMVLATETKEPVMTDEGTAFDGDEDILVLGLSEGVTKSRGEDHWHPFGGTATIDRKRFFRVIS